MESYVYIGNLTPQGEYILNQYLDKFLPDATRDLLQLAGLRGKMGTRAKKPDVVMIIIDAELYAAVEKTSSWLKESNKAFIYTGDDVALEEFLISMFGEPIETSQIEGNEVVEDSNRGIVEDTSFESVFGNQVADDLDFGENSLLFEQESENAVVSENKVNSEELENLRAELEDANKTIESLTAQLEGNSTAEDIEAMASSIRKFKSEIKEKDERIKELEGESYQALGKITKAEAVLNELTNVKEDYKKARTEIGQLTHKNKKLQESLDELSDYEEIKGELGDLQMKLSDKEEEIAEKIAEIKSVSDELDSAKNRITNLDASLKNAKEHANEVTSNLEDIKVEKEGLIQSVEDLKNEINGLNTKIKGLEKKAKDAEVQYTSVKDLLDERTNSLKEAENSLGELDNLRMEISDLQEELKKSKASVESLKEAIKDKDIKISNLNKKVKALELEKQQNEVETSSKIQLLEDENSDLISKVEELTEKINISESVDDNKVEDLKEEIAQLSKRNESLSAEIDNYRTQSEEESGKTLELHREIDSLKSKVTKLTESNKELKSKAEKSDQTKALRKQIAELEIELNESREMLDDLSTGVFVDMQNSALPKVRMGVELPLVTDHKSKFVVISGGSSSSNLVSYQSIRKVCEKYKKKKIIVLDLVSDSFIDSELRASGIKTPTDWLLGNAEFSNFMAKTAYKNVRVLSTGLSYINTLCFLSIDWESKFEELNNAADFIIVYVGCLSDVISKILFQSFSAVMQSRIIVNATPINIRSTILSLAGISNMDEVRIGCCNYDNSSEMIYKKLAESYDTHILGESDVCI